MVVVAVAADVMLVLSVDSVIAVVVKLDTVGCQSVSIAEAAPVLAVLAVCVAVFIVGVLALPVSVLPVVVVDDMVKVDGVVSVMLIVLVCVNVAVDAVVSVTLLVVVSVDELVLDSVADAVVRDPVVVVVDFVVDSVVSVAVGGAAKIRIPHQGTVQWPESSALPIHSWWLPVSRYSGHVAISVFSLVSPTASTLSPCVGCPSQRT